MGLVAQRGQGTEALDPLSRSTKKLVAEHYLGAERHEPVRVAFQLLEIQQVDLVLDLNRRHRRTEGGVRADRESE